MVLEKTFHFKVSRDSFRTRPNIYDRACAESRRLFLLDNSSGHAPGECWNGEQKWKEEEGEE